MGLKSLIGRLSSTVLVIVNLKKYNIYRNFTSILKSHGSRCGSQFVVVSGCSAPGQSMVRFYRYDEGSPRGPSSTIERKELPLGHVWT